MRGGIFPDSGLFPSPDLFPGEGARTSVVLDPPEAAEDRVPLDLNAGPILVDDKGLDWGDAAIAAAMADMLIGSAPADFRIPNRQVKLPLLLGADGVATYEEARADLQQKVALLQREGGWLGRGELYADVMNATLAYPDKTGEWYGVEADVVLTLECLPDFYGDEIPLADHAEATLPELVLIEPAVEGDHPARVRLVISNGSAADQRGLLVGVRSRHYDPAPTARLAYDAEAMTPLDAAATAALSGASGSGSNTIRHNDLSTSWTPVMSTNLLAGTFLTHQGSYRVWARAYTTSTPPPSVRLVWDVGDLVSPEENAPVTIPGTANFYAVDLGEIRLDAVRVGAHRWQGQLQAKGAAGGENVYIDRLWLVPLDEGAAKLQAAPQIVAGLAAASMRDEFNQTAGALTGKTAAVGGTWAAPTGGLGTQSAVDLTVDAASHLATRTDNGETFRQGRCVLCGAGTLAAVSAQIDVLMTPDPWDRTLGVTCQQGIVVRYVDGSNWLALFLTWVSNGAAVLPVLQVVKCVANSPAFTLLPMSGTLDGIWSTLMLQVHADGVFQAFRSAAGAAIGAPLLAGQDTDLATGGPLESGQVGIYDEFTGSTLYTRKYDNFLVYPPAVDAVAYAGAGVQVGTDGNFRASVDGAAYGQVSTQGGDLLRLPPSGVEGRTAEVFIKLSRGDLDQLPDSGIDDLTAKAYYRPCYLFPYGVGLGS